MKKYRYLVLAVSLYLLVLAWAIASKASAQTAWTQCAGENQTCTFTGTKLVRYGNGSNWSPTKTLTSPVGCNNTTFAPDPFPGNYKVCQIMDVPVVATPPTPGTTVKIVSWDNPTTNTDGTPVCTITGTKVQASLTNDFAGWLQWDTVGAGTNIRITTVPNNVVLYWRAATLCGTVASDWSTPAVRTEAEWAAVNVPPCAPYPLDPIEKATTFFTAHRTGGGAFAYFCKLPDGTWKDYGKWGAYDLTCISDAYTAAKGTDIATVKDALKAVWTACSSPKPEDAAYKPLYDSLIALNKPVAPPPVASWKVATNGTYTTRPAYALVNGSRTSTVAGRVAVGSACDCTSFKSGTGASTYCAVTGNENTATAATDQLPASAAICTQ